MSMNAIGVTPIAESALSPGGWRHPNARNIRDPSSARTATPGGYTRRKRLPSKGDIERAKQEAADFATPITAAPSVNVRGNNPYGHGRDASTSSLPEPATALAEPRTALKPANHDALRLAPYAREEDSLPSPAQGVFARLREQSRARGGSRERNRDNLEVHVVETRYAGNASPGPSTGNESSTRSGLTGPSRAGAASPPLTGNSVKGRAIDAYINSVEVARQARAESRVRTGDGRQRGESRGGRGTSRVRDASESRGRGNTVRYIKPAKRSPSSPVPMSPEEIAQASQNSRPGAETATTDDESFYKIASPIERRSGSLAPTAGGERAMQRAASPSGMLLRTDSGRGRSDVRTAGSNARSPSSPLPMAQERLISEKIEETQSDGQRCRIRARSSSRQAGDDLQSRRAASKNQRDRIPDPREDLSLPDMHDTIQEEQGSESSLSMASDTRRKPRGLSRKQIAARELEDRRLSLARRPSAPSIPLPGELMGGTRPSMSPRSHTDLGDSPHSLLPPMSRSHTVDPEAMSRYNKQKTSSMLPPIGLPATPRAMRHPKYMGADGNDGDGAPPVPQIPGNYSDLSSMGSSLTGSNLSQVNGSNLSQVSSSLTSYERSYDVPEVDDLGPLLPSTVFGQKGSYNPIARSASAPPEKMAPVHPAYKAALPTSNRRVSMSRGHVRKISPPDAASLPTTAPGITSIDEALHSGDQQVIIIEEDTYDVRPPLLPELQHLAGPPPPPPPPTMFQHSQGSSDVINIAIDGDTIVDLPSVQVFPTPMERATTASPSVTRHGRGSGSVSETFGSRFRGVTGRMRSTSRSRAKSPPMPDAYKASPYETVLPPMPTQSHRRESISRAKSPYEQAMASQNADMIPPPPPPPAPPAPGMEGKLYETTIPPANLPPARSQSAMGGYRNPKEIRANMPPETLQQGVYGGGGFL